MNHRKLLLLAITGGLLFASTAFSQSTRDRREEIERIIDSAPEQVGQSNPTDNYPWSEEADAFEPSGLEFERDWLWDVGAWTRLTHTTFDTQLNTDRVLQDYDLRIWGEASYGIAKAYGRIRTIYTRYESGDAPDGNDNNWQRPRLDQGYITLDLGRALKTTQHNDLSLIAGRQFVAMGSGMALANVVDGIRLEGRSGEWRYSIFAAETPHYSPDFDGSVPEDRNESDRLFVGASFTTRAFQREMNTTLGAYFLAQIDQNNKLVGGQGYDYDSYYFGVTKQASLNIPGLKPNELSFRSEAMLQFGRSTARGGTNKESINAYAYLFDLYWLPGDRFPIDIKSVFSYYFGSGDADRFDQHSTVGGNEDGTSDNALNYFGYVATGYSLAPKLTNLQMFRWNLETKALEDKHAGWFRRMKVGFSAFLFWKHHHLAPITDFTSVEDKRGVGYELDVYADMEVASDFDVGLRAGVFVPGNAFAKDDTRNFFSFYLNLSF